MLRYPQIFKLVEEVTMKRAVRICIAQLTLLPWDAAKADITTFAIDFRDQRERKLGIAK